MALGARVCLALIEVRNCLFHLLALQATDGFFLLLPLCVTNVS